MAQERYRQPFPILESYPLPAPVEPKTNMEVSNMLNARMIERQGQINALEALQTQDQAALVIVREAIRQSQPRPVRRRK